MPSYYEFYQVMIHRSFLSAVTHQENQWYRLSTNKLRQVMGTEKCPLSPTMEITSSGRVIIDANDDDRRVEGTSDWCRHKGFGHRIPASDKKEHRALWWRPLVSKCEIRRHKTTLTSDTKCKWHHWLNGCEFEQVTGIGDGQGSLVCCSSWGHNWATVLKTSFRFNNFLEGFTELAESCYI